MAKGLSHTVYLPCPRSLHAPDGHFGITLTGQFTKDGSLLTKECTQCHRVQPVNEFLGKAFERLDDGYLHLFDGDRCFVCDLPVCVSLNMVPVLDKNGTPKLHEDGTPKVKLAMRALLRYADGSPVLFWDEKRGDYLPSEEVGMRLVEKGEVYWQPYSQRGRDRYGV